MRIAITTVFVLALVAAGAQAAPMVVGKADTTAAPGGSAAAEVEITNTGSRAGKFKVFGRILPGENGGRKGKRVKEMVQLAPGESTTVELACPVPDGASGTVTIEIRTRGPGVKDRTERHCVICPPDGGSGRVVRLEGALEVVRSTEPDAYDKDPNGFAPWVTYLELTTADQGRWNVVGPEARFLASLMLEAGLTESTGWVEGIPAEYIPSAVNPDDVYAAARAPVPERTLFLLEWEVRGVEDPRDKLVPFRYVLSERASKIAEATNVVVDDEDAWERLLAGAGIELPDELPPWEGEDDVFRPLPAESAEIFWPWQVDLEKETVLAVFAGQKRSTGYAVHVTRIVKTDEGLTVYYAITEPWKYGFVIAVPTAPFAIVAVRKTEADVRFVAEELPADPTYPEWPWYGDPGFGYTPAGPR